MKIEDGTLIGLSLSGCIRDIAKGKVESGQVKMIIAGTNWKFPEQLDEAIERYGCLEWDDCIDSAAHLLKRFWARGKIIQPRNYGYDSHNIAQGHWAIQVNLPELL